MYNNRSCPQTPAPPKDGVRRFPLSAAILETPSIMSSFRELEEPHRTANGVSHPPAPKQFIMSYSSNSMNDGGVFSAKATPHQHPASTGNHVTASHTTNGSFLDGSFSSNYITSTSTVNRKVPLANSSGYNTCTNGTYKGWSSSNNNSLVRLNNFHRSSTSSGGTNLNATFHSYSGSLASNEKRKHQTVLNASKYSKSAALSSITGTNPDAAVSSQNGKTSLRILSGTIEHLQKTIREQGRQLPLLLETVANVVSIKPGMRMKEKVILLRHRNQGPVMQGIYYEIDHDLPLLEPGDLVRCVGRLQPVGSRLQILKISRTSEQYGQTIMRLQTVSAFTTKVRR